MLWYRKAVEIGWQDYLRKSQASRNIFEAWDFPFARRQNHENSSNVVRLFEELLGIPQGLEEPPSALFSSGAWWKPDESKNTLNQEERILRGGLFTSYSNSKARGREQGGAAQLNEEAYQMI